jgi:hypothetical protein
MVKTYKYYNIIKIVFPLMNLIITIKVIHKYYEYTKVNKLVKIMNYYSIKAHH